MLTNETVRSADIQIAEPIVWLRHQAELDHPDVEDAVVGGQHPGPVEPRDDDRNDPGDDDDGAKDASRPDRLGERHRGGEAEQVFAGDRDHGPLACAPERRPEMLVPEHGGEIVEAGEAADGRVDEVDVVEGAPQHLRQRIGDQHQQEDGGGRDADRRRLAQRGPPRALIAPGGLFDARRERSVDQGSHRIRCHTVSRRPSFSVPGRRWREAPDEGCRRRAIAPDPSPPVFLPHDAGRKTLARSALNCC